MNNFAFFFVIVLCGTRTSSLNVERTNRISGGLPATNSQFPYMISLQQISQLSTYTRGHRCGGALVSLRHAVTSASCLHESRNGALVVINPSEYRVFAGAAVLTDDNSADRHRLVESFTIHPNYNTGTPNVNDIAIITLDSAFPSNAASTVSLSVEDPSPLSGVTCESSGWGSQNDTSSASTQLMHITMRVFEPLACGVFYSGSVLGCPRITMQDSIICAMPSTESSSRVGDLGNPLVCDGNLNGILFAIANDCSGGAIVQPEVYTRISSFRQWIETTSGTSTFQPGMAVLALICIVQIITTKVLN